MADSTKRRLLVEDVVDKAEAPEPVRAYAERALARRGSEWGDVSCVARVQDPNATDPSDVPKWLVVLDAPDLRSGDLLAVDGWGSGGLSVVGDDDAPGGSRVTMSFDIRQRVRLITSV